MLSDKEERLKERHVLHSRPEEVLDELFESSDFFDPSDRVQLKYEMLRRVRVDGWSVTRASKVFGLSRVGFYRLAKAFEEGGVIGLATRRSGPSGRKCKLSEEMLDFIVQLKKGDKSLSPQDVAELVVEKYGVRVNPLTIVRSLLRQRVLKGRVLWKS